ncbi:MAG: PilZ domain-containing protein [Planctomycetota bacterium]
MTPSQSSSPYSTPEAAEHLPQEVRVSFQDQLSEPGRLFSIDHREAQLSFDPGKAPALPLAEDVELVFVGLAACPDLRVSARLTAGGEARGRRTFTFRIQANRGELGAILAHRDQYRVQPRPGEPVKITLVTREGATARAILKDISPRGVSAFVAGPDEARVCASDKLEVRFSLPDGQEPFCFQSEVRHRTLTGERAVYGLSFRGVLGGVLSKEQERLRGWCQQRQLEDRRERRERRESAA